MPSIKYWRKISNYEWRLGNWLVARIERAGDFWYIVVKDVRKFGREIYRSKPIEVYTDAKNSMVRIMKAISRKLDKTIF